MSQRNIPHQALASFSKSTLLISLMVMLAGRPGLAVEPVEMSTLSDPSTVRGMPVMDLVNQAPDIIASASYSDMKNLADAIEQVYANDQIQVAALSYDELRQLQRFYNAIDVGQEQRRSIVAAWLREVPDLQALAFSQQAWLLDELDPSASAEVIVTLKTAVLSQLAPSTVELLEQRELASAVRALAPHLEESEKTSLRQTLGQRWASQIASKSSFSLTDAREAAQLRSWQEIFDLLGDFEADSSQYIAHLPEYLAKMTVTELYWRFRYEYVELLAQPIRDQAQRDELFSLADQADLRQDILHIISSSSRQTGVSDQWHARLDALINDVSLSDDRRAQWMIAKAYSLGLTDDTHQPIPLAGQPLLEQAIELAESDATRVAALGQMVFNDLAYFLFDQAREDIARYRDSISPAAGDQLVQIERTLSMVEHIDGQLNATDGSP